MPEFHQKIIVDWKGKHNPVNSMIAIIIARLNIRFYKRVLLITKKGSSNHKKRQPRTQGLSNRKEAKTKTQRNYPGLRGWRKGRPSKKLGAIAPCNPLPLTGFYAPVRDVFKRYGYLNGYAWVMMKELLRPFLFRKSLWDSRRRTANQTEFCTSNLEEWLYHDIERTVKRLFIQGNILEYTSLVLPLLWND